MRSGRESIVRAAACPALAALALLAGACAHPTPVEPPLHAESLAAQLRAERDQPPDDALVVRLAFHAGADLDLYVTDPLQETVYFANTPTRAGGALDADRTCDDSAPRIETIAFAAPASGRYRIGVDHAEPCDDGAAAPFAVRAERGGDVWEAIGAVAPRRFEPIVLEIEID